MLGPRALNRALLARQLLLARAPLPAEAAIERLVGLQAQEPLDPYVGLWTRLEPFRHADLADLLTARRVVRIGLMRSTIHLVSARDCLALRPVVQPVLDRSFHTGSPFGRQLAGLDLAAVVTAGRALLEREPLTPAELGRRLRVRWPDRDATALAMALRTVAPLVQLPPRGVWGVGGLVRLATAEVWLGGRLGTTTAPDGLILRYLAALGPASVLDVQAWSGLTRLDAVLERLRPRLRAFRDENGRELFDMPDAPRPDPDTPAPVRFLPEFDNVFLGHADRARIVDDRLRRRLMRMNGRRFSPVLVDGFVGGTWRLDRHARGATLRIAPSVRLSRADRAAVLEEGERLAAFLAANARSCRVVLR